MSCFYQKRLVYRDNKDVLNTNGVPLGWWKGNTIRVPSLKRSKNTWKRFYKLFPSLKGEKCFNCGRCATGDEKRIKLKKV